MSVRNLHIYTNDAKWKIFENPIRSWSPNQRFDGSSCQVVIVHGLRTIPLSVVQTLSVCRQLLFTDRIRTDLCTYGDPCSKFLDFDHSKLFRVGTFIALRFNCTVNKLYTFTKLRVCKSGIYMWNTYSVRLFCICISKQMMKAK